MVEIKPNTILDLSSADVSIPPSQIDQYDKMRIYDSTYGPSQMPPNPTSLNFVTNTVSDWVDLRNAWLTLKFQIVKINANDKLTCRSDPIRNKIAKASMKINDTIVNDVNYCFLAKP